MSTLLTLTDEKKLLQKKVLKLQFDIADLTNRFASIAQSCNLDEEGKAASKKE